MEEINPQWIVTETWLTKKPSADSFLFAGLMTAFLAIASLLYWHNIFGASSWMPVSQNSLNMNHQYWRLVTALFAHADEKHLLSNSFLFFILGGLCDAYYGKRIFPLFAFGFGALTNIIVVYLMPPETMLLGASGIVFWLGGFWLTLYFLIDLKHSVRQRILRALGVGLVLFFPAQAFDPSTSYSSHLLGFFFGIAFASIHYFLNRQKFLRAIRRQAVIED
jgi:rhomboid protease GluP